MDIKAAAESLTARAGDAERFTTYRRAAVIIHRDHSPVAYRIRSSYAAIQVAIVA